MAGATGFEVKGLNESIKLLATVAPDLRKEAGKVVRKAAIKLKREAQSRLAATPGVRRRRYPVSKTVITHRATATAGRVGINTGKSPIIGPAEFGWRSQFVPYRNGRGRFMPQNAMRRRTFPIWRGNQFKFPKYGQKLVAGPGWIVQPVLRKRLGAVQKQVNDDMFDLFGDKARQSGIPRG